MIYGRQTAAVLQLQTFHQKIKNYRQKENADRVASNKELMAEGAIVDGFH